MERLTKMFGDKVLFPLLIPLVPGIYSPSEIAEDRTTRMWYEQCVDKLAQYENTKVDPEGVAELIEANARLSDTLESLTAELAKYRRAEHEGRSVSLPVSVNETLWCVEGKRLFEVRVRDILITKSGAYRMVVIGDGYTPTVKSCANIGKTVFRTREECECREERL